MKKQIEIEKREMSSNFSLLDFILLEIRVRHRVWCLSATAKAEEEEEVKKKA